MAIPYETPFHHDFSVDGKATAMNNFKTVLETAGWTTTNTSGEADGTFTALPTDGQTITIDGVVYTAKNTPVGGNDFQIGADATATATNLFNKINATHTTVTATNPSAGVVRVTAVTSGPSELAVSAAMSNFSWNFSAVVKDGYKFKSPATTEGLAGFIAWFHDGGEAIGIRVTLESVDGLVKQTDSATLSFRITTNVGGRRLRCISHKHGFFIYLANTSNTEGTNLQCFTVAAVTESAPSIVSNVSNSGGLIKITTTTAHGLTTGNSVHIAGVVGVPANGTWTITVVDTTSYTLNGSTFSGAYTSGGAAAGPGELSQVFVGLGDRSNGITNASLRGRITTDSGNANADVRFVCANSAFWEHGSEGGIGRPRVFEQLAGIQHHSGEGVFSETWCRFNSSDRLVEGVIYGMMHNAGLFNAASIASDADSDKPFEAKDLKIFWRYTWNQANGTLCVRVPGTNGSPPTATITVL